MPLILAVSRSRVTGGSFRYSITLPLSWVKYWQEKGFEIKRVEFTEDSEGRIVLKPVLTPRDFEVSEPEPIPAIPAADLATFVASHS